MKLSELIKAAEEFKEKHGDIEVVFDDAHCVCHVGGFCLDRVRDEGKEYTVAQLVGEE